MPRVLWIAVSIVVSTVLFFVVAFALHAEISTALATIVLGAGRPAPVALAQGPFSGFTDALLIAMAGTFALVFLGPAVADWLATREVLDRLARETRIASERGDVDRKAFLDVFKYAGTLRQSASAYVAMIAGYHRDAPRTVSTSALLPAAERTFGPEATVDRPLFANFFSSFPLIMLGLGLLSFFAEVAATPGAVPAPLPAPGGGAPQSGLISLILGLFLAIVVQALLQAVLEVRYRQAGRLCRMAVLYWRNSPPPTEALVPGLGQVFDRIDRRDLESRTALIEESRANTLALADQLMAQTRELEARLETTLARIERQSKTAGQSAGETFATVAHSAEDAKRLIRELATATAAGFTRLSTLQERLLAAVQRDQRAPKREPAAVPAGDVADALAEAAALHELETNLMEIQHQYYDAVKQLPALEEGEASGAPRVHQQAV